MKLKASEASKTVNAKAAVDAKAKDAVQVNMKPVAQFVTDMAKLDNSASNLTLRLIEAYADTPSDDVNKVITVVQAYIKDKAQKGSSAYTYSTKFKRGLLMKVNHGNLKAVKEAKTLGALCKAWDKRYAKSPSEPSEISKLFRAAAIEAEKRGLTAEQVRLWLSMMPASAPEKARKAA